MTTTQAQKEYLRRWRASNKRKVADYHRKWMADRPGYRRKQKYNLSPDEFEAMVAAQNSLCALCTEPLPEQQGQAGPHVDHNHETGKVRGILCPYCNKHRVPVLEWLHGLGLYTHPYLRGV